ncbi:hypothetical protein ACIRXL_05915 [Avibacterium paragallinarum]|uniref:hypothetical protein n=1 Tax=Avibacterium paragallinarum TaxID=728 RepID=UPI00397B0B26
MKRFISFILVSINFLLITGSCVLGFYGYFFYSQETREQLANILLALNTLLELLELFVPSVYIGSILGLIFGMIYFAYRRR